MRERARERSTMVSAESWENWLISRMVNDRPEGRVPGPDLESTEALPPSHHTRRPWLDRLDEARLVATSSGQTLRTRKPSTPLARYAACTKPASARSPLPGLPAGAG